ncbi:ribonuclease HII [Aerophototrophica crusticola]|uniref:Ribonuclease HII n=1 Tax=Aerophototrophica crusticola TaxID=1709002 RepID=A0A858R7A0_9PROT|nr:ribonuclease HII [Rhodospirillaceae bacterium B3]
MPDLSHEIRLGHAPAALVCGVDEAGRGPLAGPVVAAAVILPPGKGIPAWCAGIDDSKALKAARREALFEAIRANAPAHGIGIASVEEIDEVNILRATFLAMGRAVAALGLTPAIALVDGNQRPPLPCRVETLVDGDALSLSIAAASILAKVTRDKIMGDLAREYPGYGWERNAGYGTAAHKEAIRRLGVTPHHRRSFAPVSEQLSLTL